MKNNILKRTLPVFLILLFAFEMTNAQVIEPQLANEQQEKYDYYSAKSEKLKKTGIILVSAGGGLLVAGIVIAAVGVTKEVVTLGYEDSESELETGGIMLAVGGASVLASIPVFIVSGSKKRKAKAYLEAGTGSIGNITFDNSRYVSIGLKIDF